MRHPALCLLLPLIAGCRATADERLPPDLRDAAAIDGGFRRSLLRSEAAADLATPQVLAIDPVVAQLLHSAFAAHATQRRVSLENIANVNTVGFKRRVVALSTEIIRGVEGEQFTLPVVTRITPQFTPGALEATNRTLDLAIDGAGFFQVVKSDGSTCYTRDGAFQIDHRGQIVTGEGQLVLPGITLPTDLLEVNIDPEGRVTGRTAGNSDTSTLFGQFTIHNFVSPERLRVLGSSLYEPCDDTGAPITGTPGRNGLGSLKQGFLERSNVEMNRELVSLQILERQHQTLTQVMRQFGMIAP